MRNLVSALTAAILSVLALTSTASASVGVTTVGSSTDSDPVGQAQDYAVRSNATGTVNQLSIYLASSNTANKVELGLYSSAKAKLGSCVVSPTIPGAWNRCAIPPVSVTNGTSYLIALLRPTGATGTIQYRYTNGSNQTYGSRSTTLASLPDPWVNGPNWGTQNASLYADSTGGGPPPPSPPTAAFTFTPASPVTGSPVSFDGSASTCPAGGCSYAWTDLGPDGVGGTDYPLGSGQQFQFTFNVAGTKYVQLKVTDSAGQSATVEHDVAVGSPAPPADSDGDGVPDSADQCPGIPPGTQVDANGCPVTPPPADSDGDGVPDSVDQCPGTPPGTPVDANGCPITQPPPGGFPTEATTGTPPGWTPSVTRSTDMTVNTPGAVVQDIRFTNGANLTITARDVTVKNVELQGGRLESDNLNTLIEDSTINAVGTTVNDGEGVISYCGYTILRVKILDRNEGIRSGCSDPVVVQDSFVRIVPPSVCGDWHGDGLQGYTGGPVTITNTVFDFHENYGTSSFCGGTAPIFYPRNQGNTHLDANHVLVKGGGYSFRDGMPGSVTDLQIAHNTGVDGSWHFGPIDVNCPVVSPWSASIVTADITNGVTTRQSDQPCDTGSGGA